MIWKLRHHFIRISVAVLALAMLLLTIVINAVNWGMVCQEIDTTISELASSSIAEMHGKGRDRRGTQAQEAIYESRYFIVNDGPDRMYVDVSNVASYTEEEARSMAKAALASPGQTGFMQECFFRKYENGNRIWILFLDCGSRLRTVRQLLRLSFAVCAAGILLSWLLMALLSRRAIWPILKNSEKQKRFITDASHELKTPLSVISANMDVLAFDDPDNEWIQSTRRQIGLMNRMIRDLVFLSRADEETRSPLRSDLDLAQLVRDTAAPFVMMAQAASRAFHVDTPEQMTVKGDAKEMERMISVLCDNAVKHSPEGDLLTLRLSRKGPYALIETENTPAKPLSEEKLAHLFDRFYRADESRAKNAKKGGFGIGLAIALAVAENHGGSARAFIMNGKLHIQLRIRLL